MARSRCLLCLYRPWVSFLVGNKWVSGRRRVSRSPRTLLSFSAPPSRSLRSASHRSSRHCPHPCWFEQGAETAWQQKRWKYLFFRKVNGTRNKNQPVPWRQGRGDQQVFSADCSAGCGAASVAKWNAMVCIERGAEQRTRITHAGRKRCVCPSAIEVQMNCKICVKLLIYGPLKHTFFATETDL